MLIQQDCEEAILALITGAVWEEALRLVRKQVTLFFISLVVDYK